MSQTFDRLDAPAGIGCSRTLSILLWLALTTGWLVSIFSVIEEMCLATACSDAAIFTFFGVGMGLFGIAYFSLILLVLWLRPRSNLLNWVLAAQVYSGIGAEFRLLWIQKYIIGGWCPLCVTICCTLFFAAALLMIESAGDARSAEVRVKRFLVWLVFVAAMSAAGLAIAFVGIKALV